MAFCKNAAPSPTLSNMRGTTSLAFVALAMGSFAQAATVYLAGDSTMAKNGANDGATDGTDGM